LLCWAINFISVIATFYLVRFVFSAYFQERYGEKKLIQRINFSFPLSNISIRSYLLGTVIGLLPETVLNVVTGYLIKHEVILLSAPETHTWQALVIGGVSSSLSWFLFC